MSAPVAVSAFTASTIEERASPPSTTLRSSRRGCRSRRPSAARRTAGDSRPVERARRRAVRRRVGCRVLHRRRVLPGDIQGIDLNALERVEVIRGPQSALYGRNTYSGAINFITRQPTEDLEARVRAVAAQYGEQDYSFSVGSSFFDDKFGAKIFARSYSYDGEYKNTLTGRKVGDESTKSVGLSLNWKPIEDSRSSPTASTARTTTVRWHCS